MHGIHDGIRSVESASSGMSIGHGHPVAQCRYSRSSVLIFRNDDRYTMHVQNSVCSTHYGTSTVQYSCTPVRPTSAIFSMMLSTVLSCDRKFCKFGSLILGKYCTFVCGTLFGGSSGWGPRGTTCIERSARSRREGLKQFRTPF